ncbi:MAG TPA: hypothetical protein VFE98_11010 [Candidatus Bathyarchaeia archaeon]|nr:hypothetical protein [Candidatus Bathyarchaeia archaeon]
MSIRTPTITWSWKPISTCPGCGSTHLELDQELESFSCNDCGYTAGGAMFWEFEE